MSCLPAAGGDGRMAACNHPCCELSVNRHQHAQAARQAPVVVQHAAGISWGQHAWQDRCQRLLDERRQKQPGCGFQLG